MKPRTCTDTSEMVSRYEEAKSLMIRMREALDRAHYEDGETVDDVMDAMNEWVSYEMLETDIFEYAITPIHEREGGDIVPDLTGIDHNCEHQKEPNQ